MHRFSAAFGRRKSTLPQEDFHDVSLTAEPVPSFRVLERHDWDTGKSFDGGARMNRGGMGHVSAPRPVQGQLIVEDNMFAGLNMNRGSGASHITHGTSTDASSRHSNTSTAPSSADIPSNPPASGEVSNDVPIMDGRSNSKKSSSDRATTPKSSTGSFLDRAGRTFSFSSRKASGSPRNQDAIPEVPPLPSIRHEDAEGRSRGLTTSTASTATPPRLEGGGGLDMGGDFGSMFNALDKRGSTQTMRPEQSSDWRNLTGNRAGQSSALTLETGGMHNDDLSRRWNHATSDDNLISATSPDARRALGSTERSNGAYPSLSRNPSDSAEEEHAMLIKDSLAAGRFLANTSTAEVHLPRKRLDDHFSVQHTRTMPASFTKDDDNLFDSSMARMRRQPNRFIPQSRPVHEHKVMSPAEFERYRKDREHAEAAGEVKGDAPKAEDDEDEINYDDDEDDAEKSKQQAKQRRKQEAHMAVYRQQMMKVTGEPSKPSSLSAHNRPSLASSLSAPQLNFPKIPSKTPSPVLTSSDDEDDEVPLAILQAHGFPAKSRPPNRLSTFGSNPNLRTSAQPTPPRPGSAMAGDTSGTQRQSSLPAFARNLPQDPFVGASIARPAIRESLSYGGGAQSGRPTSSLHPGGLVGVIASEERSKAMRRGSPNMENQMMNGNVSSNQVYDPVSGIPHQMMYNQDNFSTVPGMQPPIPQMQQMPGMPQMFQPMLTPGDQAQIHMNQQMQQFMQMQMHFMQMMATNQNHGGAQQQMYPSPAPPQQPQQSLYANGRLGHTQSMGDLSGMLTNPGQMDTLSKPTDAGTRTFSMIRPNSASFVPAHAYARSIHGAGQNYAPSIAPSERSNIGLPGRYRPVTQAVSPPPGQHSRSSSAAGSLTQWDNAQRNNAVKLPQLLVDGSDDDDDDEEGWAAMQAKREERKLQWKTKKDFGDFSALM